MDKLKILVVDDEARMRKLVRDFLEKQNYQVMEAGDGEEAVDLFFKEKDIALIEPLLPKQMSADELKAVVQSVIAEIDAKSPADMGKVMKALMPKVKGLAANDQISKMVKELLS